MNISFSKNTILYIIVLIVSVVLTIYGATGRSRAKEITDIAELSIATAEKGQYVDLTNNATSSVFDTAGNLLAGAAAIISALTVSNRIKSYRRYKKPSLLERIFHIGYKPQPPTYQRKFRPKLNPTPAEPRRTIRTQPQHRPAGQRPAGPSGHGSTGHSGHGPTGPSGHGRR